MANNKKAAVVLAAGKGKRMKSDLPKVVHKIDGRPMIQMVVDTLQSIEFDKIVIVIGHKGELVEQALGDYDVEFVWQREQLGTGHAVMMAEDILKEFDGTTLIALGDVPFLSADSINLLMDTHRETAATATCLSAVLDDATGYGRIIRDGETSNLIEIVEHRDATEEVRKIGEFNTGTFCFDNRRLYEALNELNNDNSQGEYYLTDTIKILRSKGLRVSVVPASNPDEVEGINSVEQLKQLARKFGLEG